MPFYTFSPNHSLVPSRSPPKKGEHRHLGRHHQRTSTQCQQNPYNPKDRNQTHRSEVTRGTLLVTGVVSLSVFPVSTSGGLVGTTLSSLTTSTTVAGRSASRSSGLHVGLGNNLGGDVEVFSEVGETLVGEGVVVPLPRELGLDESPRGEGLHGLDDFEVSDSHVGVLGSVKVLGSDEDTLLEEVLVDLEVSAVPEEIS